MTQGTIKDIEKINLFILTLGSIAIILFFRDFKYFLSFALGSAIVSLNFRLLKNIIAGSFSSSKVNRKALLLKLPLKFFGLLLAVSLIIIYGDIDVIYFTVGLTTVFISILLAQIPFFRASTEEEKNGA